MSASYLRAEQPLHGDRPSDSSLRVVLVTNEPLYRVGVQCAFRQAQTVILLDGTTIADAVVLAKSRLADMLVIDTTNLEDTMEMAKAAVIVTHIQPAGDHIRGHRLIQINVVVLSPWLTLHNGRCPGRIKTPNQQHSKE